MRDGHGGKLTSSGFFQLLKDGIPYLVVLSGEFHRQVGILMIYIGRRLS